MDRERFPDPGLDSTAMEERQREVARRAAFVDDLGFDPGAVHLAVPVEGGQATIGGGPTVVGIDQAFHDGRAVSAAVALRGGHVVERAAGRAPIEMDYIPGLLSFREGPAIVETLDALSVDPDLLVVDGSGRIHFRQAGLATHLGVVFDAPALGVAKNLLCGTPAASLDDPLPEGARVAIEADDSMDASDGTVVGYAFQSRQYPNPGTRHVNPLYVSPGHRVSTETAVALVEATCTGYKLPAPTRLADRYADELT